VQIPIKDQPNYSTREHWKWYQLDMLKREYVEEGSLYLFKVGVWDLSIVSEGESIE
jgi:hypothetical protein